jgi:hypothetical protein
VKPALEESETGERSSMKIELGYTTWGCWQEGALCGDGFRAYESKPRPNCPVSIVNGRCAGGVRSPAGRGKSKG